MCVPDRVHDLLLPYPRNLRISYGNQVLYVTAHIHDSAQPELGSCDEACQYLLRTLLPWQSDRCSLSRTQVRRPTTWSTGKFSSSNHESSILAMNICLHLRMYTYKKFPHISYLHSIPYRYKHLVRLCMDCTYSILYSLSVG